MHVKKISGSIGVLLNSVLVAGNIQASTITGSVSGYFSNVDAGHGDYTKIENHDSDDSAADSSIFSWGLTRPTHRRGNEHHKDNERQRRATSSSRFEFDGIGSDAGESGFSVVAEQVFSLGDFIYVNEATYFSRGVKGVDFSLGFELDGSGSTAFTYELDILNTPNNSRNPADFISLANSLSTQSILHENIAYELEVLGFSRDGGNTFEVSTWADEGSSTSAEIYARFNVSAVPVPAAAWLFGSGLLGLLAFVRRQS